MTHRRLPKRPRKELSSRRIEARKERERRRNKVYLLSLQDLPPEKLERIFRKVRDGEVDLIGLREKPSQKMSRFLFIPEEEFV